MHPVKIYDPSVKDNKLNSLPNKKLEWQGTEQLRIYKSTNFVNILSGTRPSDSPTPVVIMSTNSLTECVIAGVVSSIGILSTIFFFTFNVYFSKNP